MAEPLQHVYRPRGAPEALLACRDSEVLLSGPAGTGKSRACLEKLHFMALLNPGMRGLIVRKTLSSLGSTALVTWREHVAKEALAAGDVVWYGGSQQESPQYRYSNGSVIVVGGMDKATRIMSSEYDVVYCQEAIELTETDWESITTRLRNGKVSFQQLMADTNPDAHTHWLNQRQLRGATTMLECRHEDNPVLVNEDGTRTLVGDAYITKLDNLTGVRHKRLRLGLWVAADGIIYEEWDPAIHLVTLAQVIPNAAELEQRLKRDLTVADLPEEWPRYWSVDFGFVNPFVLQCWAQMPDGQLLMYREIYQTKKTVDEHAVDIMKCVSKPIPGYVRREGETEVAATGRTWTEPTPRAILCDHDAENRASFSKQIGLPTRAAKKLVKDGIDKVIVRLKKRPDGKPGLMILRDSVVSRDQELVDAKKPASTPEEFATYVWHIKEGGLTKDEPVKENDHGMDALRYLVVNRDPRSQPSMRTLTG